MTLALIGQVLLNLLGIFWLVGGLFLSWLSLAFSGKVGFYWLLSIVGGVLLWYVNSNGVITVSLG